jgi:isopenicillin-N epimerase
VKTQAVASNTYRNQILISFQNNLLMYNSFINHFLLNQNITFLNFGSFGATAKPVFNQYQQYQLQLEEEPVQFITVTGLQLLQQSREALANYIHCNANDVVYVTNPSYAVNIIAKSFALQAGDEILTTDLEYGACEKTLQYYCDKVNARLIKQPTPFPLTTKEAFVENFFKGVTANTKMIFISHITSTTGLRLPVEEICAKAKSLGLITFVDGAHAPGQVPVNLQTLEADIYTGACHKWMLTPKGSSFLYVKKQYQQLFDPLVVSWGYKAAVPSNSLFLDYHQTQGTRDFSAFLTIPTALQFMEQHNWTEVSNACKQIVLETAPIIINALHANPIAPIGNQFLVQLYSTPIKTSEPEKLKALLYYEYKIEIPVMRHYNAVYLRYSIQAFNTIEQIEYLAQCLKKIMATTNLIEV